MSSLERRYIDIQNNFNDDTILVAVTKYHSSSAIIECLQSGIFNIAESRVQEALKKMQELESHTDYKDFYAKFQEQIVWHFLGHLQRNKVKQVVEHFDLIQSLDSIRLAREINKQALASNIIMDCLLQVNIGQEEQKYGFSLDELDAALSELSNMENIKIKGLMAMAPFFQDVELTRPYFKQMKQVFNDLKKINYSNMDMEILSMGMSNDYKIALEEGANMVRLGSILFNN